MAVEAVSSSVTQGNVFDNQWLTRLRVSYKTQFSSVLCSRLNICSVKVTKKRLSCVVACWLRTVYGVVTYTTCTSSLCGTGELWLFRQKAGSVRQAHQSFGCCPPLWSFSGSHHPGIVTGHSRSEHLERIPRGPFTHSIIPKHLKYTVAWCGLKS